MIERNWKYNRLTEKINNSVFNSWITNHPGIQVQWAHLTEHRVSNLGASSVRHWPFRSGGRKSQFGPLWLWLNDLDYDSDYDSWLRLWLWLWLYDIWHMTKTYDLWLMTHTDDSIIWYMIYDWLTICGLAKVQPISFVAGTAQQAGKRKEAPVAVACNSLWLWLWLGGPSKQIFKEAGPALWSSKWQESASSDHGLGINSSHSTPGSSSGRHSPCYLHSQQRQCCHLHPLLWTSLQVPTLRTLHQSIVAGAGTARGWNKTRLFQFLLLLDQELMVAGSKQQMQPPDHTWVGSGKS